MSSVLVAEDEFLIRAVLVDALAEIGIDCIEASTGQAALDVLTSDVPLGAVIVDLGLPDMSGERVIEAAAKSRPDLPVICCSGSGRPSQLVDGHKIHVFPKPYSATELSKFVASMVARATA